MQGNIFDIEGQPEVSSRPMAMSLSSLATLLGDTIRRNPALQQVWVTAELSDVRTSGHCYMELIEKDVLGRTVAKMRAQIWQSTFNVIRRKFYQATGSDIRTGLKVMVRGSATHHNLYGFSFNIVDIDPSYTLGDMERLRREILEQLTREGVVDANKKLPMPMAPQKVAVISAEGAAGYGDFINQLSHSSEGFIFYPLLYPAVLQGDRTSASVRQALDMVEQAVDFWDCVVIIRGGGATTDLNGFDDLELARRVATFPLPVIVGIGHERDRTVLDEIACVRCKTPTAVAEFLLDRLRQSYGEVTQRVDSIADRAAAMVNGETRRLGHLESTLPLLLKTRMGEAEARIERLAVALPASVTGRLQKADARLNEVSAKLPYIVSARYDMEKRRLETIATRAGAALPVVVRHETQRLESLDSMVRVLSPQNTLNRGFSVTRVGGKALRKASDANKGEIIETVLAEGTILSQVK